MGKNVIFLLRMSCSELREHYGPQYLDYDYYPSQPELRCTKPATVYTNESPYTCDCDKIEPPYSQPYEAFKTVGYGRSLCKDFSSNYACNAHANSHSNLGKCGCKHCGSKCNCGHCPHCPAREYQGYYLPRHGRHIQQLPGVCVCGCKKQCNAKNKMQRKMQSDLGCFIPVLLGVMVLMALKTGLGGPKYFGF